MSGIDYMTIAKWVGHRDGGILIGKVYGHPGDDHARAQAMRVNLECFWDAVALTLGRAFALMRRNVEQWKFRGRAGAVTRTAAVPR